MINGHINDDKSIEDNDACFWHVSPNIRLKVNQVEIIGRKIYLDNDQLQCFVLDRLLRILQLLLAHVVASTRTLSASSLRNSRSQAKMEELLIQIGDLNGLMMLELRRLRNIDSALSDKSSSMYPFTRKQMCVRIMLGCFR